MHYIEHSGRVKNLVCACVLSCDVIECLSTHQFIIYSPLTKFHVLPNPHWANPSIRVRHTVHVLARHTSKCDLVYSSNAQRLKVKLRNAFDEININDTMSS